MGAPAAMAGGDWERPVTKSTVKWDHGLLGMGNDRSSPERGWWELLPRAQTKQAAMKDLVSWAMVGQQKRRLINSNVR